MKPKMIRTSVQLTPVQVKEIRKIAEHSGISFSDVIRRAVSHFIVLETIDAGRWEDNDR